MRGSVARYGEAAGFSPRVSGTPIRENGKDDNAAAQTASQTTSPAPSIGLTPLFTPKQFSVSKRRPPRYSEGSTPVRSASKMLPVPRITRQGEINPESEDLDAGQEHHIIPGRTPRNSLTPRNAKRITVGYMADADDTPEGSAPKTKESDSSVRLTSILRKPKGNSLSNSDSSPMNDGKKYIGRISGSEEFMWAHPRPSTWSKKQGLDSDEQYMPDKYLPLLSKDGFYTEPALQELASRDMTELKMVEDFTVGRHGVGKIRWIQPVDVRGLDLDLAVDIQQGEVAVYPERDAGQLDAAAEVTLENMFRKKKGSISSDEQKLEKKYENKLRAFCTKNGLHFMNYNPETGHWIFEVTGFATN
ncbi:Nuclear pore complex protein NUP98B [Gracilariopsis chorda]|uniref:Nuclear pore complex protein NUP98B n=1 Tax=Gracilariopsis chorda TaxID=448386 RepID=A0A2V3ICQ9_9FLOR|nr:Nuclear pore complex protein NUP98B [Gracilariopsis chorda]|eukprot:PXF39851.1 Nuclear pore complex protein NUP98B [Gracilariopsis chorda]